MPLSTWLVLPVITFVLICVEESVNCIDYNDGLGCRTTLWINVVLLLYVLMAAWLNYRYKKLKPVLIISGFALLGLVWEMLAGGLSALGRGPFFVFMSAHVVMSYLFILVIPVLLASPVVQAPLKTPHPRVKDK